MTDRPANFKPLLAATVQSIEDLSYPLLASPKLDGIRCLIVDGEAVSRSLKPIPNKFIRDCLRYLPAFDGELIVGNPTDPKCFQKSTSGVMSQEGEPDFTFFVFDQWDVGQEVDFRNRTRSLVTWFRRFGAELARRASLVIQQPVDSAESLGAYEEVAVAAGWEGVMVRSFSGAYKHGRSTLRDGILGKVKRFDDMEAEIVGFEELMRNGNEQTRDALGHAERSTAKDGLIPAGTLGALICKSPKFADTFKIGTGFDAEQRARIWAGRDLSLGSFVKFKHQPAGAKDKPRFPVFLGFRSAEDMVG